MSEVRIAAESRTEFGKGFARRARKSGKVPAVLYGHGEAPRHVALPARELLHAFKGDSGSNVLLVLELDGGSELALPRQIQRDPLRGDLTHVDLLLVRRGEKVTVEIPVVVEGDIPGTKVGGRLEQMFTSVSVEAEATHIPTQITVDGSTLTEVGITVHAGDLTLPEGVTLNTDPEAIVLQIAAQTTVEAMEADLGAPAEAAEPAADAEAAPDAE